jgi:hypothetical protein
MVRAPVTAPSRITRKAEQWIRCALIDFTP